MALRYDNKGRRTYKVISCQACAVPFAVVLTSKRLMCFGCDPDHEQAKGGIHWRKRNKKDAHDG